MLIKNQSMTGVFTGADNTVIAADIAISMQTMRYMKQPEIDTFLFSHDATFSTREFLKLVLSTDIEMDNKLPGWFKEAIKNEVPEIANYAHLLIRVTTPGLDIFPLFIIVYFDYLREEYSTYVGITEQGLEYIEGLLGTLEP
jgi:hypothetical protein